MSLSENLCLQPCLSPPVSCSTHLRIPHQRFTASLHQSHTNERHYTLQSVWFKNDLESFPSAARNGKLPRDKLRIHLQYSKDIKGFKLCIGFIGSVRTTEKLSIRCEISITEREARELLWSRDRRQLLRYAAEHAYAACLGARLLRLPVTDLPSSRATLLSACTDIPDVLENQQITFFPFSPPHINSPCTAKLNSKQKYFFFL